MATNKPQQQNKQGVHNIAHQKVMVSEQKIHQGPIPSPEALASYEAISPGFADRLVIMAEKEQANRHEQMKKIQQLEVDDHTKDHKHIIRGQVFALIAVVLVILLCVYALYLGFAYTAQAIAIGVISAIAAVFVGLKVLNRKK